jgi:predicted aldo/keto reductase-like oxidoreductase
MHRIINEAVSAGVWDVILTVVNFTLADYSELYEAIENAAAKGVGVIAMKTQAGSQRRTKIDFGDEYSGSTIATASLKWVLQNKNITTAVPGYTTFEHMREDFSVVGDLTFSPEEKKLLSDQKVKVGMGFCRQCELCLATCPRGVDIPTLMRTHMYAARYTNFHQARAALSEIPEGCGLEACSDCRGCTARCMHSVDIAGNIDELRQIYV